MESGETVAAWIRVNSGETLTEDDVKDFCRDQIAYFKVPKYIRFVDTFPITVTGKIKKYEMRNEAIREYGLSQAAHIETA